MEDLENLSSALSGCVGLSSLSSFSGRQKQNDPLESLSHAAGSQLASAGSSSMAQTYSL
jgi:hypothetical protein